MHTHRIIGIVACTEDYRSIIGYDGDIPWHIQRDQQFFRDVTLGNVIIMGRKTYDSTGYLPKRLNLIHSRSMAKDTFGRCQDIVVVQDRHEALDHSKQWVQRYHSDICIIGGKDIYEMYFPLMNIVYVTYVGLSEEVIKNFSNRDKVVAIPEITHSLNFDKSTWEHIRLFGSMSAGEIPFNIFRYSRVR